MVAGLLSDAPDAPVVLDSGCGTGGSTAALADRHTDCIVIGIDRSLHRLRGRLRRSSSPRREGRCIWVRAELASFWRLALQANWPIRKNYLLYPNPWPKPAHLARRWHGHPVFPDLLRLPGGIELRTNWPVYAEEFAFASRLIPGRESRMETLRVGEPLTPFEAKYQRSGHCLYRVVVEAKKSPGEPGLQ